MVVVVVGGSLGAAADESSRSRLVADDAEPRVQCSCASRMMHAALDVVAVGLYTSGCLQVAINCTHHQDPSGGARLGFWSSGTQRGRPNFARPSW